MNSDNRNLLTRLLAKAIDQKSGLAVFRLPNTSKISIVAGDILKADLDGFGLENAEPGFIIAPFINKGTIEYIKGNLTLEIENDQIRNIKGSLNSSENLGAEEVKLPAPEAISANQDYMLLVEKAVNKIQLQELKKVVLARSKFISTTTSPVSLFLNLLENFHAGFISLIYHPEYGVWCGTSPEMLVSLTAEKVFKTVALAGTQRLAENQPVSDAVWKQKEIEEQALVSRYIINCFKSIRLREFEEEGPKTIQSGNLLHLKTSFAVLTNEVNEPYLLSKMLQLLHPTSAVGGMPREEAIDFIKQYEKFDRALFSGFIGPVNIDNAIDIFVNIRCARFFSSGVQLFAGAGITAESVAENEFAETELKMDTICNFLA